MIGNMQTKVELVAEFISEEPTGSSLDHLRDVLNGRVTDDDVNPELPHHCAALIPAITAGELSIGRDEKLLREMVEQQCFLLLDTCAKHMEVLPEWFLTGCVVVATTTNEAEGEIPATKGIRPREPSENQRKELLRVLLRKRFDHRNMLKAMRNLPFKTVLLMAQFIQQEVENDSKSFFFSLEAFAWISVLIESHFTEWAVADDAHITLFRLSEIVDEQVDSLFMWQRIQGQLKALIGASKVTDGAPKEDLQYWHSVIEF